MKSAFIKNKYRYFKEKFLSEKKKKEEIDKQKTRMVTAILRLKDNEDFRIFWSDILVENYLDAVYSASHKGGNKDYEMGCVDTFEFLLNLLEKTTKEG